MKFIKVYDNIIPMHLVETIHDTLDKTGFTRTEYDHSRQVRAKVMSAAELNPDDHLPRVLLRYLAEIIPNPDYNLRIYRMYANCYTPADCPEPHQDQSTNNGFTILYYAYVS